MYDNRTVSERLKPLIRDIPDFPSPGIVFKDIAPLLRVPSALRDAVDALAAEHREARVDAVAGIESRGFVLGAAVAYVLGTGFVPVRKQGRLPGRIQAIEYSLEYGEAVLEVQEDAVQTGDRVLIVDDLLATGGTAAAAATLVERVGGRVEALAFLVELTELGGAAALGGRRHTALIRY